MEGSLQLPPALKPIPGEPKLFDAYIDFYHIARREPVLALCALWLSVPQARAERLSLSAGDIRGSWIYPVGAIQQNASGPSHLRPQCL